MGVSVSHLTGLNPIFLDSRKFGYDNVFSQNHCLTYLHRLNTNVWKLGFWVVAHIMHKPDLASIIRAEVMPSFKVSESPTDLSDRLECCERLVSTYYEVLRVVSNCVAARTVVVDIMMGNKKLRKGAQVILPFRQILMDEGVFGSDAKMLNIERFLAQSSLLRSPSFRPFGGGKHHCPGRFMARKEVLMFTALLLTRFEARLAEGVAKFPEFAFDKPNLGIFSPAKDDNVILNIRPTF